MWEIVPFYYLHRSFIIWSQKHSDAKSIQLAAASTEKLKCVSLGPPSKRARMQLNKPCTLHIKHSRIWTETQSQHDYAAICTWNYHATWIIRESVWLPTNLTTVNTWHSTGIVRWRGTKWWIKESVTLQRLQRDQTLSQTKDFLNIVTLIILMSPKILTHRVWTEQHKCR